ncbi:MAG: hypothetical protein LBR14_03630 [Clostridiales Family XIII bacterium]|jgi:hypothetical protein|nr:hypothetical protein [Clostridiales Family XIII bacterium]
MARVLKNWTYKKHAVAETAAYLGMAVATTIVLKNSIADEGKKYPKILGKFGCTKAELTVGGILAASYAVSMTASYLVLKKLFSEPGDK